MWFVVQILANSLAIYLADYLLDGFYFSGDILSLAVAGLVLGLINFFIKPVLKIISAPLIILSLGLFTIIINIGLLWLLNRLVDDLSISGFSTYFWSVLIISAINIVFRAHTKKKKK